MKFKMPILFALTLCALVAPLQAQIPGRRSVVIKPLDTAQFHTRYIQLGGDSGGLYYEPTTLGPKARIALVLSHPDANNFDDPLGREMAGRGYRVILVDFHGPDLGTEVAPHSRLEDYLPSISRGITYLRSIAGVQRVLVVGHSSGAAMAALYGAVSTAGPSACQGADKIDPCDGKNIADLQKADGLVLEDSPLGALQRMTGIDAALTAGGRDASLDMFSPANGYDPARKGATYSAAFMKRYNAAQRARHIATMERAQARLKAIEAGKGEFEDDELFQVRGIGAATNNGARLFDADVHLLSHTKKAHLLLRADGSNVETVVQSVREPEVQATLAGLNRLNVMSITTTVRHYLATFALRTTPDYGVTEDDITGVDWHSAYNSPPANAELIALPTLVMTGNCGNLFVPDEIIYDHLASKDKTYAIVEGATHGITPCRPQYGDTRKRTYDFIDGWLTKPGRF